MASPGATPSNLRTEGMAVEDGPRLSGSYVSLESILRPLGHRRSRELPAPERHIGDGGHVRIELRIQESAERADIHRMIRLFCGGRRLVALALAVSVLLISACGTSSISIPQGTEVACHALSDCFASAKERGVDGSFQVPSESGVTFRDGWFYSKSNPDGWGFRLEFWNDQAKEPFEELIGPMSIKLGCPLAPGADEPLTSPQGFQVCYEEPDILRFFSGGLVYQIDIAAPGKLPAEEDRSFLLGVLDSLKGVQVVKSV